MGPIVDRSLERLVATDVAIVQARRRLLAAAEGLAAGKDPIGLDTASHLVRSASLVAPTSTPLSDLEDLFKAKPGQPHTSI
jgi:hypothetical protein